MLDSRNILGAVTLSAARRARRLATLPACFALAYVASAVGLAAALFPFGASWVALALGAQLSLGFALALGVSRARRRILRMAGRLRARDPTETLSVEPVELGALGELGAAISDLVDGLLAVAKRLEDANVETVKTIALAMEARDPYTQGHCLRVRYLTRQILEAMGAPSELKRTAEVAALLHDVGKIGVPDSVLLKSGRLTSEEFARIIQHVYNGAEIVSPVAALKDVRVAILHHHERYDGKGYPHGLAGGEIPLASRVIAVADTIDAMRSTRPYRPARKLDEIVAELGRARGTQLDPEIVDVAISILERRARRTRATPGAAGLGSLENTQRVEVAEERALAHAVEGP